MFAPSDQNQSGEPTPDNAPELERGPNRRCLATGTIAPKAELMRFVVGPQGELLPDFSGKLPGRGLWITPTAAALKRALEKRLFQKAAGSALKIEENFLGNLLAGERRRALALLGLARRAGLALAGFEKVKAALAGGRVRVLLAASDGADDGRGKLAALASGRPIIADFTSEELALALGRHHVVHVALLAGGLTESFQAAAGRLRALSGQEDAIE